MSVYIKGMEMPTSCGECKAFVCYKQWAGDRGDCFCGITKSDCKAGAQNADCPLVHVPPHGRLIDADALIPMMKYATTDSEIGVFPIKIGFNAIIEVINNAPTIDAEPVRHGKWELAEDGWYCSACELYPPFDCDPEEKGIPYCPYCGARMDEDERD